MVWFVLVWSGSVVGRLVGRGRGHREGDGGVIRDVFGLVEKWLGYPRVLCNCHFFRNPQKTKCLRGSPSGHHIDQKMVGA